MKSSSHQLLIANLFIIRNLGKSLKDIFPDIGERDDEQICNCYAISFPDKDTVHIVNEHDRSVLFFNGMSWYYYQISGFVKFVELTDYIPFVDKV